MAEKQPLSSGDALFLYLERDGQPINVASVGVFEGVIPLERALEFVESKLPLIPRYRQRLVAPIYNIDLPSWEHDPKFDLRNHLREITLKHGTETEFKAAVGRILSTNLDRRHPLWDMTLVHGLKGNRTGVLLRIHHCMVDGIAGVEMMNVLMGPSPVSSLPKPKEPAPAPAQAEAGPSLLNELITSSLSAVQRVLTAESELLEMARQVVCAVQSPEKEPVAAEPSTAAGAPSLPPISKLQRLLPELASTPERLPFNVVCRGPQRFNWAQIPLAEIKAVKEAGEAKVNDVVLALVALTVRRYLELHAVPLKRRRLRIIVPVNLRGEGQAGEYGNRITFLPVDLPLDVDKPRALLKAVRRAVAASRSAHLAEMVGVLGTVLSAIPTALQALIGPIFSQLPLSLCNLICTNVPGPQLPLYFLGHRMLACYPYVPIGGEMGMNCAVMTYDGTAFFGFSGDAHAVPDLKRFDRLLEQSFAELRKAFGVRTRRRTSRPAERGKASAAKVAAAKPPSPRPARRQRAAASSNPASALGPSAPAAIASVPQKGLSSPAMIATAAALQTAPARAMAAVANPKVPFIAASTPMAAAAAAAGDSGATKTISFPTQTAPAGTYESMAEREPQLSADSVSADERVV